MKTTLTKLLTVMMLIMVSIGAKAQVKVLFGENGDDKFKSDGEKIEVTYDGGTIVVTQETVDANSVTVYLAVTPNKGYSMKEKNVIEAYAVIPADANTTRALTISEELTLECDNFKDETSSRTYHATIDSNLALWVKSAEFVPNKRDGAKSGTHPYEGIWYLTNNYKKTTTYFVVPAADPQITETNHVNEDAYFSSNYSQEAGDPEKPFLTTYMTNGDLNSIWILVPVTGENDYYYIVHAKTGKYLKFQTYLTGNDARRKFVHLETISTPSETEKFQITELTESGKTGVKIKPKNHTYYFNIAAENRDRYNGYEDGVSAPYYSGIIGGMNGTDGGSLFTLSDASSATDLTPVISDVNGMTTTFTITSPAAAFSTIRYTTDGTTTPNASTGTTATNGVAIDITAKWTVQAVGVFGTFITPVAGPKSLTPIVTPVISFNNTTSTASITCATPGVTIYYTTDGTPPTTSSTPYTVPFPLTSTATVKAIATRTDFPDSEEATNVISKVATPVTNVTNDGKVKLESTTPGVTIFYEIGDDESSVATPTMSSSRYTTPLSNVSGKVIKAIAVREGWITSDVGGSDGLVVLQCAMPVIRRGASNTFTITCSFPAKNYRIYYTIDGTTEPTTSSAEYTSPVSISSFPITIKAIATADGYKNSSVATETITEELVLEDGYFLVASSGDFEKFVTMVNAAGSAYKYKVVDDFTVTSTPEVTKTFTGTFEGSPKEDGSFCIISGLRKPLFNTTSNAVIKNVMLKDVQISGSGAKGAIAGTANDYTRIYNCGILPSSNKFENEKSDISSSDGNCGGLVGELNDDSRVVNCFSYAKISGGTVQAGIVGNNQTASTTAVTNDKYANLKTMVVNCMFYGDITGSSGEVYPVYGGSKILNTGNNSINNYNFYREKASITPTDYNCSWPASEENLTRFEYYRYLLNSNRELCGWWVGASSAPSGMSTTDVQAVAKDASLMAKWVLDPALAPYPILKSFGEYPSVINPDPDERIDSNSRTWVSRVVSSNTIETNAAPDTKGETLGTVSVTIYAGTGYAGSGTGSDRRTINITAMDIDNNDFCYGKIQLPYYNEIFGNPDGGTWDEKYGGNYKSKVVTGWDITTSEGTLGTFSDDPITGYNFADRYCTAKDTHRTFAQGGFYYVPYGVTSITITAHWANAYYLCNTGGYYDRVYFSENNSNKTSAGQLFAPTGARSFDSGDFGGQTINNNKTIASILTNTVTASSVYDCAIVLVSNYQYRSNLENIRDDNRKPFTLMTVDLDFDNEPDYCFEWQFGGGDKGVTRAYINPVRFDFLPIVELGIAMKENNSKYLFTIGKLTPYGHFETTETALIHMGQLEYDDQNRNVTGPVVLNNGTFDQICRGSESDGDQNVNYFILGGHVKMPSFTPGSHVRKAVKSRHCAVNVLGGEIPYFYLSGNYIATPTNEGSPHCYIDGGKLDFVASGAKEQIVDDVIWKIDHGYIGEFYGGGINADKPVKGSISTTINRSKVTKFCGGPQFGNMESGKTVTTEATGTTFGVFYGAGNGGTCYSQYDQSDNTSDTPNSFDWETNNNSSGKLANYTALTYRNRATGYHAKYELEMINGSAGTMNNGVCRTYMYAAQFATTNTGKVESTLIDCTVEGNFFGGGMLGGVTGNVTSTLTSTSSGQTVVRGSVYGGGYGIADLTVDVFPKGTTESTKYTAPTREANTSVITAPKYPTPTTYIWTHNTTFGNTTLSTTSPSILNPNGDGKNYLYTEIPLDDLGKISGNATLTIKGNTHVEGNVYGGGDKGKVYGSTEVNIEE